jgi:hypothetical protein
VVFPLPWRAMRTRKGGHAGQRKERKQDKKRNMRDGSLLPAPTDAFACLDHPGAAHAMQVM